MKFELERAKEQLRSVFEHAVKLTKRTWNGYGYYISLACMIVLFGTAAYLYRTDKREYITPNTEESPAIAAMSHSFTTPEPAPSPMPYEPKFILPVSGDITNTFSYDELRWNNTLGQWRIHTGIDIAANTGSAVVASESGTISAVYEDDLLGSIVEITHEEGWVSRYCSLESHSLAVIGTVVEQGEIIASVGTSALSESADGPHLHFEILKNGVYIEPVFEE